MTKKYRAGYGDGSGEEYILADKAVLTLRWGCSCCKDTSPLNEQEVAFRDKVVKALNTHARMEGMLRRIYRGGGGVLPYNTYTALRRLLEELDR